MIIRTALALVVTCCVFAAAALSQATAPAEPPRKEVTVPPGFKLIVQDHYKILAREADEAWVRQALADKTPTTKPTTMPADLLSNLTGMRDQLASQIASDLALADPAEARKLVDEDLIPLLTRASAYRPPVYFLVTSRDHLRDVVRGGWTDPAGRFHYNRAADQVSIPMRLELSLEGDTDDQVLTALYDESTPPAERQALLESQLRDTDGQLAFAVTARSLLATQMALLAFINRTTLDPMNLSPQQQWFAVGTGGVLSSRYLAMINQSGEDSFLRNMMTDDRRNPVRAATVNLLNPMDLSQLREAARPAYVTAMQRKSTAVVHNWLERAGDGALPKVIAAIRANPPADGPALVKLIADQTGIDLTKELLPK